MAGWSNEPHVKSSLFDFSHLNCARHLLQYETDSGIAPSVFPQDGRQEAEHRLAGEANVETANRAAGGHLRGVGRVIGALKDVSRLGEECPPSRCELDAVLRPSEQFNAEFPLERRDLLAKSRLHDVQTLCGMTEMHVLGHGNKVPEVAKFQASWAPSEANWSAPRTGSHARGAAASLSPAACSTGPRHWPSRRSAPGRSARRDRRVAC